MTENNDVTSAAIKIGTRIIHALWAIMVMAVAAAFAIGASKLVAAKASTATAQLKLSFWISFDFVMSGSFPMTFLFHP